MVERLRLLHVCVDSDTYVDERGFENLVRCLIDLRFVAR